MVAALLGVGSSLEAYPVKITINATFVAIPGQTDMLGLGTANPPVTAQITTTLDSSLPQASYPATVFVTIPGFLDNSMQTGSLSINANGQISANFSAAQGSFSAVLALPLTFPSPVPLAFGNSSFSSPSSSVMYNLLGESGTVGINGTVSAVGLTASPASISSSYTVGGTAPAPVAISISSNDPSDPAQAYTVAVTNATTPFVTLSSTSGTTPGSVTATFSTSVAPGTYTADIAITSGGGAPLNIPVTYAVTAGGGGGGGGGQTIQIAPSALTFQFFAPVTTSQSQTLSITSSKAASYTAAVGTGSNFLSVSSTGGNTPGNVSVTANPGSLAAGTYSGSIVFSSPSTPTVTVPVTMTIAGNGGGGGSSTLTVLPTLLRFNYVVGQPTPPAQTLTVFNPAPVSFTVSNILFYVPVTPTAATTPATVSVTLNPTGLTPGSYTDTLAIHSANGGVTNIPVIVNVSATATPSLMAAPASLSFTYSGTAPAAQTIAVMGNSALNYAVNTTTPWLSVTPGNGTTPGSLTVTANPQGLAIGNYTGSLNLTAPGAATLTIPITFNVTQLAPSLGVTPAAVAFAYNIGGTVPVAQTVTLTGGTGNLSVAAIAGSWLNTAQTSPTVTTLSINPANLAPGVYTGALKVTVPGTATVPTYVPVSLTVSTLTAIGVSSTALTFNSGGAEAVNLMQTLGVSTSDGSPVSVTSDSPWLTVSAASVNSGSIVVTATPGSLANGVYTGNIVLNGAGATPQVVSIPVTFNLGSTAVPQLNAVTNGISFQNNVGSPGLIVALWGQGLGPATPAPLVLTGGNTLSTTVAGTQVTVDGIPSPILFSSATQVNALLPFALVGQTTADVQLFYQGVPSSIVTIPIEPATPGIFTASANGAGGGAILNQDLSVNSASNPAAAGTIIAIYAGGGGQTNPQGADGLLIPLMTPFPMPLLPATVTIGGQPAVTSYYGEAPGLVDGVLQINATIPSGTPSGPQPVQFSVGTAMSQPNVVVYVK